MHDVVIKLFDKHRALHTDLKICIMYSPYLGRITLSRFKFVQATSESTLV